MPKNCLRIIAGPFEATPILVLKAEKFLASVAPRRYCIPARCIKSLVDKNQKVQVEEGLTISGAITDLLMWYEDEDKETKGKNRIEIELNLS